MRNRMWAGLVVGTLLVAPSAWATTYRIDPEHTTVGFKIRHLFSNVQGTFDAYEGTIVYVPGQPEQWSANATIQTASVNTRVGKRDAHLRSKDFFAVDNYPTMTFNSTKVTEATATSAKLAGILTLHGIEKPVVLNVDIHGEGKDPWGNLRAGFTATTRINRQDFGLTWNKALESGGLLVGDEVDITLEVEGVAQP